MSAASLPQIIQGGMGVGISGWRLARAVSQTGQLGVVSGTAMEIVMARQLQLGDADGSWRKALESFPFPHIAEQILDRYFLPGGKAADAAFVSVPMHGLATAVALTELTVAANYCAVWLARQGHHNPVGINFLEKIQLPLLPSIYGAMLAGGDVVLMGAGIPRQIPGILRKFSRGAEASYRLDVSGLNPEESVSSTFDPGSLGSRRPPELRRPAFLVILSSSTLALNLFRKTGEGIDGFVVEGGTAGGHNAPPRGARQLDANGEPIYGPRDSADLVVFREMGLPFWLAGGFGRPEKLAEALAAGARGVQVGTAFAFCEESGLDAELGRRVVEKAARSELRVFTDPLASPTGFPFKVVGLEGTLSEADIYGQRNRVCDLGFLRHAYRRSDGHIGFRCPGEGFEDYVRKGGLPVETQGRKCICNGLLGSIGLGQQRRGGVEAPLITAGNDALKLAELRHQDGRAPTAAEVVNYLLGGSPANR